MLLVIIFKPVFNRNFRGLLHIVYVKKTVQFIETLYEGDIVGR